MGPAVKNILGNLPNKTQHKKPNLTKKHIKVQNLNQAVMILQKNQIQMTESRA